MAVIRVSFLAAFPLHHWEILVRSAGSEEKLHHFGPIGVQKRNGWGLLTDIWTKKRQRGRPAEGKWWMMAVDLTLAQTNRWNEDVMKYDPLGPGSKRVSSHLRAAYLINDRIAVPSSFSVNTVHYDHGLLAPPMISPGHPLRSKIPNKSWSIETFRTFSLARSIEGSPVRSGGKVGKEEAVLLPIW